MIKTIALLVLTSIGLWLSTGLVRGASIPGLVSLEKQIAVDFAALKNDIPEFEQLGKIDFISSEEGGISKVWANEILLKCFCKKEGTLGAEILLIPLELETGPAATVQVYIYDLKSGQFVKEISRLYQL